MVVAPTNMSYSGNRETADFSEVDLDVLIWNIGWSCPAVDGTSVALADWAPLA